jgi:hypothetical protein
VLYCIHRRDLSQLRLTNLLPVRRSWRRPRFTSGPPSAQRTSRTAALATLSPMFHVVAGGGTKIMAFGCVPVCVALLEVALVPEACGVLTCDPLQNNHFIYTPVIILEEHL